MVKESEKKKRCICITELGLPWGLSGKEFTCNAGDVGSIPGLGRSPAEGNDYPHQHFCLGNPIDKRDWCAIIHGVAK